MHRGIIILSLAVLTASVPPLSTPAHASASPLTAIRLVPKPVDRTADRRARNQPSVPPNYKEMPFVETAPEPVLTAEEKQRGYMLFGRPIAEPVYPNSRPLAHAPPLPRRESSSR